MNTNAIVSLKTMADLETESVVFYIDAYQRGYRWTETEVKDLLEDIYDFSQSGYQTTDRFYCLQPIIVTKNNDEHAWKVIDGQQRLTTLFLIYLFYDNTSGIVKRPLPFQLQYKGKEKLKECLKEISDKRYYEESSLEEAIEKYGDDIDCYYILTAYSEVCRFFNALISNAYTQNRPSDMRSVFDNYMRVIWYELIDCDEQTEITMFTNINMGKIPLTNAELIKALLLRAENDEITTYQENIAIKWDDISASLSEEDFWSFLVNDSSLYSTRIDFIFEIMAHEINENELVTSEDKDGNKFYIEKAYNRQYFSFYVFNNYVKFLKKNDTEIDCVKIIWGKINEYYQMFKDWYQNRRWYHLIGFIVASSGDNYIEKLCELSAAYKSGAIEGNHAGHKTVFENYLREMVINQISPNSDSFTTQDLRDMLENLEYGSGKDEVIRNFLLLYNISSLEMLEGQTDARFPFEKYKSRNISWDIEHINAVADDRPRDTYDRDQNECKIWLENAKGVPGIDTLKLPSGEYITKEIDRILDNKLYLPQNEPDTASFIAVFESIINYYGDSEETDNSLANLTLLDSGTNRSYKNSVFPLKRIKILENCTKEIYIPLCTKNVFLKAYLNVSSLLKWSKEDKTAYIDDILNNISGYLRLEDA